MVSQRYAWPVIALFLMALIPTASNFYRGLPVLTDRVAGSVPLKLAGMKGLPTNRSGRTIQSTFRTDDWVERVYSGNPELKVTLFVARSYDGRPLFHFPERGLLRRNWTRRTHELSLLKSSRAAMKVHVLELAGVRTYTKVYYLLFYGKEAVGNPYLFLLGRIPHMLVGERKPFTFFFAHCTERGDPEGAEKAIESLLIACADHFLSWDPGDKN